MQHHFSVFTMMIKNIHELGMPAQNRSFLNSSTIFHESTAIPSAKRVIPGITRF